MDQFKQYLLYNKEVAEATLRITERFLKEDNARPQKRTSNIEIVRDVLERAGTPLHVSEIIRLAKQDHDIDLNRDSIVSAILKKVQAGQSFERTAPNTFSLKVGTPK